MASETKDVQEVQDALLKNENIQEGQNNHIGQNESQRKSKPGVHGDPALDIQYKIEDVPPWYICILLGFQHYLLMFGGTIAIPLIMGPPLCMADDNVGLSQLMGTIFFVSGLVTLLQTTIGVRLPVIQGGTFAFLAPAFAILSLEKWQCPDIKVNVTNSSFVFDNSTIVVSPDEYIDVRREVWQSRIREVQGAIIVSSLFQVVIGASGAIGVMLQYIGPLAIAPTIALIGVSLFDTAAIYCAKQWWIALLTAALVIIFSQYLRNVGIPVCSFKKGQGCSRSSYPIFKLFPVILAIALSWGLCGILTATNVLPADENSWGYYARTDVKIAVLNDASWFRVPYPGQWGLPTVSLEGVFGMLAGVLAGMIESVGDYYACARLSGAPSPPTHALNRGVFIEGLGCVMAGLFGTSTGTTTYSENIGAIGITKVGSRRVIQVGGLIMVIFGTLGKFGAFFVTIPEPVIGGVFMVTFGMIAAVGISNLQFVDLNSSRNLFIFGFATFFGLSMPYWVKTNSSAINTGEPVLDSIIRVLLSTSMFVGGFAGFFLDNTIPGTPEERGIIAWRKHGTQSSTSNTQEDDTLKCYDLPFVTSKLNSWGWTRYIPLCPAFVGICRSRKLKGEEDVEDQADRIELGDVNKNKAEVTVDQEKDEGVHKRHATESNPNTYL